MPDARYTTAYHAPVMVDEVLGMLLGVERVSHPHILDCTLGGGGHSAALLEAGADVTGLDRDPEAIRSATERLAPYATAGRFRAIATNYADFALGERAADAPVEREARAVDGILLDLGVSSHQIDDPARGFSFREGAPLDMRMSGAAGPAPGAAENPFAGMTAAGFLNDADFGELATVFREYGDERRAPRLAKEVIRRRESRPFVISDDLVGAIRGVLGPRSGAPEFARIFQAVRIAVNDEIGAIERALPALRDRLTPSGVIAVITYHSGEDRVVKHAFRDWSRSCICPPRHPVCTCGGDRALGDVVTRKAVVAAADEILRNARARSARLRAWRRKGVGVRRTAPAGD